MIEENYASFTDAPDLAKPIDVYFRKQERCQRLASAGGVPISKASLVQQLQLHIDNTGLISTSYMKWKEKPNREQTWIAAKIWFRKASPPAKQG